jgi:hypothetical protein
LTGPADPRECPYVGLDPFEKAYEPFFFGREQDSRVIADHVASRSITVLYGPSGVGKSSVLNVGLPAALRVRGRPWMIAMLRDWQDPNTIEQRAVEALQDALPASVGDGQRSARFGRRLVGALRATGRPLLLILDQFEEYFLYNTETALTSAEKGMGLLLARRDLDLHVLIAMRDDSLHLLDKLRAIAPGILETTVRLGHLNDPAAEQAIRGPIQKYNELYRQGAAPVEVEDALVKTLISELRQGGSRSIGEASGSLTLEPIELPYLQLTMTKLWVAEGGRDATKVRLETLTKGLGGVQQIAREHVDRILRGLTLKEQALCADMFRNLVTSSGSKIAYPTNDLARQISEDRRQAGERRGEEIVSADDVATVLRKLTPTDTRLLKPVKANGVDAFELFHDVLGQPILRWRREFIANARLRAEQRRGRLFLGLAAVFGLITLAAVFATGYAYIQTVAANETVGRSIWSGLEFPDATLKTPDIDGLWRVTALTADQRDGFLAPLTGEYSMRGPAVRFVAWVSASLPALDLRMLDEAQQDPNLTERFGRRPVNVLRALGLRPLTDAQLKAAVGSILAEIKQTAQPDEIPRLALAIQALPAMPADSQAAIESILAAIKQNGSDPEGLVALTQALQAVPAPLTDAQARAATDSVFAAINNLPKRTWMRERALRALAPVFAKLNDTQAQSLTNTLLTMIKREYERPDYFSLQALAEALPAGLTDTQAKAIIAPILETLKGERMTFSVAGLAILLKKVSGRLTPMEAQFASHAITETMASDDYPDTLQDMADSLKSLPGGLDDAQARAAVEALRTTINNISDPYYDLEKLVSAEQAVVAKLTDEQAKAVVDPLLAVIIQPGADAHQVQDLAQLKSLSDRLTQPQVQSVIGPLIAAIAHTTDPKSLLALAQALQALAPELAEAQRLAAVDCVVGALRQTTNQDTLRALAEALQALASKLEDPGKGGELLSLARLSLANAMDERNEDAWAGVVAAVAAHEHDDDAFLRTVVETLKYPTVSAKPTVTLIAALRQRFPDVPELKGDLDMAVPWFEKELGVSFVGRPPVRPGVAPK